MTLKRNKPLRAKTRIRQRNEKRIYKNYKKRFGKYSDWIRSLPCCVCGRDDVRSTASHVRGVDVGGEKHDLVPMCGECHGVYEVNKRRYNEHYKLERLCVELWNYWVTNIDKSGLHELRELPLPETSEVLLVQET
jgi:hypothetical protein